MLSNRTLLLALLGFALVAGVVQPVFAAEDEPAEQAGSAQDSEAAEAAEAQSYPVHPLTDLPASASDVRTAYILPDSANNVLNIGEVAVIVVGLQNTGSKNYNVTAIWGSLNSPFNSQMFIQNFTGRAYGRVVESGGEASFEYRFLPSPELEPMDLQLAFTVFYEDETSVFATTFFNQTVTFESKASAFDFGSTVKLLFLLGVIAYVAHFLYTGTSKKATRKSRSTASTPSTAVSGEFAEDFLKRNTRSRTPKKYQ